MLGLVLGKDVVKYFPLWRAFAVLLIREPIANDLGDALTLRDFNAPYSP